MSKQGKPTKRKGSESSLKQPLMGKYFSKQNSAEKKTKKKKFEKMSSFIWTRGSYMDTEEYRNHYPGKNDHPDWEDNYNFYMNKMPSKPDGDFIDDIHTRWWGDYAKLERHHGYIQWLFPIRDSGMNWHAQELQMHEIEKLTQEKRAMKRLLKSYQMMLDFYGMKLKDEKDGTIARADNWRERFRHLNRSYHNYLRITRILKCLGELNYEHLKANFVRFVLYEGIIKRTLPNTVDSCMKYWIGVIRTDKEREDLLNYYDKLCDQDVEKEDSEEEEDDYKISMYEEKKKKVLATPSKVTKKIELDEDLSDGDTLEIAMKLVSSDSEDEATAKKRNKSVDSKDNATAKLEKSVRKDHNMSDSDEGFKTLDDGESQDMAYWKSEEISGSASPKLGSDAVDDDVDTTENQEKPSEEGSGDTQVKGSEKGSVEMAEKGSEEGSIEMTDMTETPSEKGSDDVTEKRSDDIAKQPLIKGSVEMAVKGSEEGSIDMTETPSDKGSDDVTEKRSDEIAKQPLEKGSVETAEKPSIEGSTDNTEKLVKLPQEDSNGTSETPVKPSDEGSSKAGNSVEDKEGNEQSESNQESSNDIKEKESETNKNETVSMEGCFKKIHVKDELSNGNKDNVSNQDPEKAPEAEVKNKPNETAEHDLKEKQETKITDNVNEQKSEGDIETDMEIDDAPITDNAATETSKKLVREKLDGTEEEGESQTEMEI